MRIAHSLTALSSSALALLMFSILLYFLAVSQSVTLQQVFGNEEMDTTDFTNPFPEKIVHFDLKGAPPKLKFYSEIFPLLKKLNVSSILMEYEDMFPYKGNISILKREIAYTDDNISTIIKMANESGLNVIPLVQTFGHMEFVLKHEKFAHLRENVSQINTVCPSNNESLRIITDMFTQVRKLHPKSKIIHIGSDEAYEIAKEERCLQRLRSELFFSTDRLKLSHISRMARIAHDVGFSEVLAWNDMFERTGEDLLKEYELGKILTPVVWGYGSDVTVPGYFPPGMFDRYAQVFDKLFFGSAFKGANGNQEAFLDVNRYLSNQASYVNLYRQNISALHGRVKGIILTGWQRYSHTTALTELFPVGIPSLVLDLVYLNNTALSTNELMKITQEFLGCSMETNPKTMVKFGEETYYPTVETAFMNGTFPGHEIYDLVEALRFLTWRIHRSTQLPYSEKTQLRNELLAIEGKIRDSFSVYFFDESIEEFMSTYVRPLTAFL